MGTSHCGRSHSSRKGYFLPHLTEKPVRSKRWRSECCLHKANWTGQTEVYIGWLPHQKLLQCKIKLVKRTNQFRGFEVLFWLENVSKMLFSLMIYRWGFRWQNKGQEGDRFMCTVYWFMKRACQVAINCTVEYMCTLVKGKTSPIIVTALVQAKQKFACHLATM